MNPQLLLLLVTIAQPDAGAAGPTSPNAETATLTAADPDTKLPQRLLDAKKLLADAKIGTDRIGGQQAVLAVWDPVQDKLTAVLVRGAQSRTSGFTVRLIQQNGVNTLYEVTQPTGQIVLAIKTNVLQTRGGRRRGARTAPAIYVPYGDALHRPPLVDAGRGYLEDLADRAGDRLDGLGVRSLADPDRLVTEMVPERVLITLMIIEHIDPDDFNAKGARKMMESVMAMTAANGKESFAYSFSYAGAGGLAQFIRSTYRLTRARYPKAKLLPDFVDGMREHRNAIMAQYCLADWSLAKLPAETLKELSAADREEELGAYLAAAYNGGESRAVAVYLKDPARWEESGRGLKPETVQYVREFRAIYRLLGEPSASPEPAGQ